MATSVGSSAAFTFGNMKPAPDEEIDALWGQNVADNTGFMRAQHLPFINTYGTNASSFPNSGASDLTCGFTCWTHMHRVSGHNRLVATFRGDGTYKDTGGPDPTVYGTHGFIFYGDIATYTSISSFATAIGADYGFGSTFTLEINLDTYLSIGSWGTLAGYFSGSSRAASNGSNRTISYSFGTPFKVYTTWAN